MFSSEYKAHVCLLHVGAMSIQRRKTPKWKEATKERRKSKKEREAGLNKPFTMVRNYSFIVHSLRSNRNYGHAARKKGAFIIVPPSLLVTYSEPISGLSLV